MGQARKNCPHCGRLPGSIHLNHCPRSQTRATCYAGRRRTEVVRAAPKAWGFAAAIAAVMGGKR